METLNDLRSYPSSRARWRHVFGWLVVCLWLAACDINIPLGEAPTPTPSAPVTIAQATPTSQPMAPNVATLVPTLAPTLAATATNEPCLAPTVAGRIELAALPGPLRNPSAMASLNGRMYVAGRNSANIGIIEDEKLVGAIAVADDPVALVADESLGKLFVLHRRARMVTMLDGQRVQATLPLTNAANSSSYFDPATMIGDSQGHRLFVGVNSTASEVLVIDMQKFSINARLPLGESYSLGALALDAANNRLLVTQYDRLLGFDLTSQKASVSTTLPGGSYYYLLHDKETRRTYAPYYKDGDFLAVIEDGRVARALPISANAQAAWLANGRLYLVNNFSNTVSVHDLQTGQLQGTIAVGVSPGALLADAKGERLYVAITGESAGGINRLDVIDVQRNTVGKSIPLAATAQQLIADPTRNRIYALSASLNALFVSDGQKVLAQISIAGSPTRMDLDEATGRLYVADWASGEVTVIDGVAGRVLERKPLRANPRSDAIAVDRAHKQLLYTNRAFALETLAATQAFSLTGFTLPSGEGILPGRLLVNPSAPRAYAVASNGVPGSNAGIVWYMLDSDQMKQLAMGGERSVTAYALDERAQRLYVAYFHPLVRQGKLIVYDAVTLKVINSVDFAGWASGLGLNTQTNHLFVFLVDANTNAPKETWVLDARNLGRVAALSLGDSPHSAATLGERLYLASAQQNGLRVLRDCAAALPAAPTVTPTPTPWPTLPPAPTARPSATPIRATPTPLVRATTAPQVLTCNIPLAEWVAQFLRGQFDGVTGVNLEANLRTRLGCPLEDPRVVKAALQNFSQGWMIWREDERKIYVMLGDNSWAQYDDTWDESQPTGGTETSPSPEWRAPARGFGKIWREKLGGANAAVGWAVGGEIGMSLEVQKFVRGLAIRSSGQTHLLQEDGRWR